MDVLNLGRIYRRKDLTYERWYIKILGKKIYSYNKITFNTQGDAQKILDEIRGKVTSGISPLVAVSYYTKIYPKIIPIKKQTGWKEEYRQRIWQGAQYRAKKLNISFNIDLGDINIPDYCPVLGIQLKPTKGGFGRNRAAPSIDRINPSLGYIKGNIAIISWRANRIKNNYTSNELRMVADWLEYLEHNPPLRTNIVKGLS